MGQVWKNKRPERMINTVIREEKMMSTGRKVKKNQPGNKLCCIVQYSKFMKDVDRADKYLSYHSILRKSVK
jgi:hypothetical protein